MLEPVFLRRKLSAAVCAGLVIAFILSAPLSALAQDKDYEARRKRAFDLIEQSKFNEARQIFEELSKENPSDAPVMFGLGFTTLAASKQIKDPEERRKARQRAREALLRAKELGLESELLEAVVTSIPPDGSDDTAFSKNKDADKAMQEGEAAFTRGNLDEAITAYARAYKLDPKLYEAPLFIGDMYRRKKDADKAGEWFSKAIAIDPDRETAYRYWGDILMTVGRMDEARDKFVEAVIAAPYSQMTWESGLMLWADQAGVRLSHPRIDIPTGVSSTASGDVNITIDPGLLGGKDDGSSSWLMYGITRANWRKDKFNKTFPREKTYRHSLNEEAEALRLVAATAKADKKAKKLTPSLTNLVMLTDAGLLESYILLAKPDKGIVRDYEEYRKTNRDKLKQYILEYVLGLKKNQGKF
jgi:tetratricopeptide (TPR) repeat protein